VCRDWRKTIDSCTFAGDISYKTRKMKSVLSYIMKEFVMRDGGSIDDTHKLNWIIDTASKMTERINGKLWPPVSITRIAELEIMARILCQFELTSKIFTHGVKVPTNIEIADMGLVRVMSELDTNTPIPSDCIGSPELREMWVTAFGREATRANWLDFMDKFIGPSPPCSADTLSHLRELLCFPSRDILTPYSMQVLSCIYGPTRDILRNITYTIQRRGFIGFAGLIYTDNIIKTSDVRKTIHDYIIRYSRSTPNMVTVTTYSTTSDTIQHAHDPKYVNMQKLVDDLSERGWTPANVFWCCHDGFDALDLAKSDIPLYDNIK
jgi:hypothetical protein